MIPFWCACCTPRQTCTNSSTRSAVESRCWSQYLVIASPSMKSITKYGRPPSSVPASITPATFGWSIRASAARSRSKRATTSALSMPSLISLTATLLRVVSCTASYTTPMPPSPMRRTRR